MHVKNNMHKYIPKTVSLLLLVESASRGGIKTVDNDPYLKVLEQCNMSKTSSHLVYPEQVWM